MKNPTPLESAGTGTVQPRRKLDLFPALFLCALSILITPIVAHAQSTSDFPLPKYAGNTNSFGTGIQRTMELLSSSTPTHRNTVKILFYGQSITEQKWWQDVAADLRRRFPNANLIIENRAIGGHSSQLLVKTAEADLYPFYPDLLIFYVYGSHIDYESIIRRVRERTTAEIVIQNDHVTKDEHLTEETDPSKITPKNWDSFMNHSFLPTTARKYGALLIDQREAWKHYLKDYQIPASSLLKDGVHLNDRGNFVMAELVKPWLVVNTNVIDRSWTNMVTTLRIGNEVKPEDGLLKLEFVGNRIDAVFSSVKSRPVPIDVLIDGKKPSSIPSLRVFNRVSAFPNSNWPCLLKVGSESPLEIETWTATLTDVSDDLKTVKFSLKGSVTGEDGEGISTERFVSKSRRVVIEPGDWNLDYCHRVFKKSLPVGFSFSWKVLAMFQDQISLSNLGQTGVDASWVIAQGLSNSPHVLELRSKTFANLSALRIYRPPLASKPD